MPIRSNRIVTKKGRIIAWPVKKVKKGVVKLAKSSVLPRKRSGIKNISLDEFRHGIPEYSSIERGFDAMPENKEPNERLQELTLQGIGKPREELWRIAREALPLEIEIYEKFREYAKQNGASPVMLSAIGAYIDQIKRHLRNVTVRNN